MKPNKYIFEIENKDLLKGEGFALDLGCGNGRDSKYLTDKGYKVTSVDIKSQNGFSHVVGDIADFEIEKGKYSLIVANNVLPFVGNYLQILTILRGAIDGLTPEGVLYFSLFGDEDEWNGKPNIAFFSESRIKTLKASLAFRGIHIFSESIEKGFGKTMKGDLKYWHIYRFICTKGKLPARKENVTE